MRGKILIIRFSSIGDIVLTSPVPRCIKQQYPHVEIHYATKRQYVSLLAANPYIDKVHPFDDKQLPDLMQRLDDEKFDLIIDLHNNLRSWLIKTNLGIENRSFNKLNFKKWLLVKLHINRLPNMHIVDRYLATLKDFGVENDGLGLDYFIPNEEKVNKSELPITHHNGYYALVIGAMHATKQLPVDKAIALCNTIPFPIVLIGGKTDEAFAEAIIAGSHNLIVNACGKYNLNQSASIIQQAKMVIANDTGMMHIAAALKKDVISIWGSTVPEFGMYPYFGDAHTLEKQRADGKIVEVNGLSCRPCSKIGFSKCPKGHFNCMQQLVFPEFPKP